MYKYVSNTNTKIQIYTYEENKKIHKENKYTITTQNLDI